MSFYSMKNKFFLRVMPYVVFSGLAMTAKAQADQLDVPDAYQNSLFNNVAYDVPAKLYGGISLGHSNFSDNEFTLAGHTATISSGASNVGIFGGYRFNNYFAMETNFQRLGSLDKQDNSSSVPFTYHAKISRLGVDGIASYPFISNYSYTASVYAKAGYGMNFTDYDYSLNGANKSDGTLNHAGYDVGLGINMDLRANVSARVEYVRYQTSYPLPGEDNAHTANVFALGVYYNFA